ncbi:MAG: TIGR01244 family sulfur transferase [Hyphomicrobiaceae bacterium]
MQLETRKLNEQVSVAGQIGPADMVAIKAAGFRAVVCNRPDGEQPGQPAFETIAAAAAAEGLETRYVPVRSTGMTRADVDAFAKAMKELPGPVLAYCRSGARSQMLVQMIDQLGK